MKLQHMVMEGHVIMMWLHPYWVASFLFTARNLAVTCKMYFEYRFVLILTKGPIEVSIPESHLPFHDRLSVLPFLYLGTGTHKVKIPLKTEKRDCNHR